MATPVELPQFGTTVEECIITRWVKQKGDAVAAGDLVAEIETDKTTFEITAPVAGTVLETFFAEGALVPVFTKICVIGSAGESADGFRPRGPAAPVAPSAPNAPNAPSTSSAPAAPAAPAAPGSWTPRARDFSSTRKTKRGPRHVIAQRMRESLASTAQYTLHASAGAAGLVAVRAEAKARAETADITVGDLVAYCTIQALRDTPSINAEFIDGEIKTHADINLGFACDTERGLLVPVVQRAQTLSLADLSRRMKALSQQAITGTISPDDLRGGTFTVSNLGGLGIETFTPLINPPQVAILGVGAIQPRPVRAGATVDFIDTISLSLTCDHQAIDGAPGARFLRTLKEAIESIESSVLRSAF